MKIRLIATDMDGTLLDDEKNVSERSRRALMQAAEKGIQLVPATGRMLDMIAEEVLSIPSVRYVIVSNGSLVKDVRSGETIFRAEIPCDEAVQICRRMKTYDAMFDCCIDGQSYTEKEISSRAQEYFPLPLQLVAFMRRSFRQELVDDLPEFIRKNGRDVQKLQMMFRDAQLRLQAMREIRQEFPDVLLTSSVGRNVEINAREANKGNALAHLCARLDIPMEQTLAFGDGSNDVTMLSLAGTGVAMGNACEEARAAADRFTGTNGEDGVASFLEKYVL